MFGPYFDDLLGCGGALMLTHAFVTVDRVELRVHRENVGSRLAVEKLGAQLVAEVPDGLGRPMVVDELHRDGAPRVS